MRIFTYLFTFFFLQAVQHLQAQTSFSWTGANSSDWANSGNWSPAGVPGAGHAVSIGSATNNPVLDSNRTIASLSMSSGSVLDLGGFALTLSSSGSFTASTVNNGTINTATYSANGANFAAKVISNGTSFTSQNSSYTNTVYFTYTGTVSSASGGNNFSAPVYITHQGSNTWNFGALSSADVFEDSLIAVCNGGGQLIFGASSTGNRMEGYCLFKRAPGATTNGITVGQAALSVTLRGQVEVASNASTGTSSTIGVKFQGCVFDTTSALSVHADGFSRNQLGFVNTQVNVPLDALLSGVSSISIAFGSVFNDSLEVVSPQIFLANMQLNAYSSFTKTGSGIDQSTGPITATADAHFINTGTGGFYLEGAFSDTFNHVYLLNSGTGSLAFARWGSGNVVQGNLDVSCLNGSLFTGIHATSQALLIEGGISAHCFAGTTILARTQLGPGGSLAVDTLGGVLSLSHFDYNASAPFQIHKPTGAGRLALSTGSDFASKVKLTVPRIQMTGVTFHDSLIVNCHVQGLASSGGLNCHGPVVLNAYNSAGMWELNYAGTPSTYYDNVYMNRFGAGQVDFGYAGSHHFKKNLYFNGTGALGTFGVWNNHMTFNGSENQIIASTNSHTAPLSRLNVDKVSGQLQINSKVSIWTNLNLTKGHVVVDDAGSLTMWTACTLTGGSDSSYVEGFISKYGTAASTFPVGRNGHYKPVSISAPGLLSTFRGKYANLDPSEVNSFSSKDTSINQIGTNEYWMLERTSGTANVSVTLYRDNMGCSYDTLDNLKITAYNGSTWKDLGNGGTSGNDSTGTISTNGVSTIYGMYTLATSDTFDCVPCRADAGEDKVFNPYGKTVIGNNLPQISTTYFWSPTEKIKQNEKPYAVVETAQSIELILETTNSKGCLASDAVWVKFPTNLWIPVHNHNCVSP